MCRRFPRGAANFTRKDDLVPVDGIVKAAADRITAGLTAKSNKARAIYEWIVDNTYRDAAVRGAAPARSP